MEQVCGLFPLYACPTTAQSSLFLHDMCRIVRTTLDTWLHTQQFGACRNDDAATPVCCESHAENFIADIAHLAAIWTQFSSFSTCLLRVLLLPKTEPVARSVFSYLQTWAFSSYFTKTVLVGTVMYVSHTDPQSEFGRVAWNQQPVSGQAVWARSIAYASNERLGSFKIILLYTLLFAVRVCQFHIP